MTTRISGATRVDTFDNEFRARLSLTVSPLPSAIRFSGALMETTGWSCQDSGTRQNVLIHSDDNASLHSRARGRCLWESNEIAGQKSVGARAALTRSCSQPKPEGERLETSAVFSLSGFLQRREAPPVISSWYGSGAIERQEQGRTWILIGMTVR